ncbi:MAG: ankyrin repeat domain-containing protein [Planctomycetota bacterium]|jgi:ankyrin repeat protein
MKPTNLFCLFLALVLVVAGLGSEPKEMNGLNRSLLQASADGNMEIVEAFLQKGGAGGSEPLEEAFDLQKFVNDEITAGKTLISIPPGQYRVTPRNGEHLHLEGLRDIQIIADGVEMVCTETVRALTLIDCRNVTLRGLTIDYDPLPFTQGRIVRLSDDSMIHEIELFEGFPESAQIENYKYEVFRSDTRALRYGSYYEFEIEKLSPRRIRITKGDRYRGPQWHLEQVGDIIVISASHVLGERLSAAVALGDSIAITLEDVTLYASNSIGFVENNCHGTTYRHCRVDRRPLEKDLHSRADPRIRSLNADAFHSISATLGPSYLDCFARFQGDDCINIHGDYHLVMECRAEQLRVLAKRELNLKPGDPVELITYGGFRLPDARVVAIKPEGEIQASERQFLSRQGMHPRIRSGEMVRKAYRVTLDHTVDLPRGSLIGAINRMGNGFRVVGCDFGFNRSRGILIKASQGEVRGNRLQECWMEAIKVAPEFWWLESGSSNDVTIVDNRIHSCRDVAIAVYAHANSGDLASSGLHNNIRIIGNEISACPLPGIVVTSTKALELRDNRLDPNGSLPISPSTLQRFSIELPEPVVLRNVEKVSVTSNNIHIAVSLGDLEQLTALINDGANVNSKDERQSTPLHYAAGAGRKDVVELLIANGADVNAKDTDGNTPGHVALGKRNRPILDLLIAKGANFTSIHLSAYQGDLDEVRSYIEKGTDVNTTDSYGTTSLHYAARRGHKEVVEFLVAKGADVNAKDKRNYTPLHRAAGKGYKDVVALLIDNSADVNAKGRWDYTPIYYAVWSWDTETAELLIEKGADVNAKDVWGWTPLHYAANKDNRGMAQLLITKGADVNAKDNSGETALLVANAKGYTVIVEMLRKHGAKEAKALEVTPKEEKLSDPNAVEGQDN